MIPLSQASDFYEMALIRAFEETVLGLFKSGKLNGTTHACIGQEANATTVATATT